MTLRNTGALDGVVADKAPTCLLKPPSAATHPAPSQTPALFDRPIHVGTILKASKPVGHAGGQLRKRQRIMPALQAGAGPADASWVNRAHPKSRRRFLVGSI